MSVFAVDTSAWSYPSSSDLRFGDHTGEGANENYITPMARFQFYDAFGNSREGFAPTIYIQMPGTFNSQLMNGYAQQSGIFGTPSPTMQTSFFEGLSRIAEGGLAGVQKQLLGAATGVAGFVSSGGLNYKSQIEFITRNMLNNFNQLIYQGPTYRRFQLPFVMKPTSFKQAIAMNDIIASFRIASSPKTNNVQPTLTEVEAPSLAESTPTGKDDAEKQANAAEYASKVSDAAAYTLAKDASLLTFGYPDMVSIELVLVFPDNSGIVSLFKSDLCVIESVVADYGAGNKMNFFEGNPGENFPTDVNFSLSLQEVNYVTAGTAYRDYYNNQQVIQ